MNTTSAKAVIEKWMGMLATGDMEAIAAMFTDDAVIDMPGTSDLPWAGRWRGRAKIDEYFKVMPAALEIREHEHKIWVAEDDMVAVTGLEAGASRISGKDYRAKWCWVFQVRDGKIALWDAYEDTEAMANCGPWK
jgi:ketosteroid isomerase-like protein